MEAIELTYVSKQHILQLFSDTVKDYLNKGYILTSTKSQDSLAFTVLQKNDDIIQVDLAYGILSTPPDIKKEDFDAAMPRVIMLMTMHADASLITRQCFYGFSTQNQDNTFTTSYDDFIHQYDVHQLRLLNKKTILQPLIFNQSKLRSLVKSHSGFQNDAQIVIYRKQGHYIIKNSKTNKQFIKLFYQLCS